MEGINQEVLCTYNQYKNKYDDILGKIAENGMSQQTMYTIGIAENEFQGITYYQKGTARSKGDYCWTSHFSFSYEGVNYFEAFDGKLRLLTTFYEEKVYNTLTGASKTFSINEKYTPENIYIYFINYAASSENGIVAYNPNLITLEESPNISQNQRIKTVSLIAITDEFMGYTTTKTQEGDQGNGPGRLETVVDPNLLD